MAREITLSGYKSQVNTRGDIIRKLQLTMLFPVTTPVAGAIPTPSANLNATALAAMSAAQIAGLDDGSGVFRDIWLRFTPKLYNADGSKITPDPAYPTNAELAARAKAIYAAIAPVVMAEYNEKYRDTQPDLPVPLGTQIDSV